MKNLLKIFYKGTQVFLKVSDKYIIKHGILTKEETMLNLFNKKEENKEKKMEWPMPEDKDKSWGARGFERENHNGC